LLLPALGAAAMALRHAPVSKRCSRHRRHRCGHVTTGAVCLSAMPLAALAAPYGLPDDSPHAPVLSPETWEYPMTWIYGRQSVTKMSDWEVAMDASCQHLPRDPLDWQLLRQRMSAAVTALDEEASVPLESREALSGQRMCNRVVEEARAVIGEALDVDTRYSTWRNDCFLGGLAVLLADLVCSVRAFIGAAIAVTRTGRHADLPEWMDAWPMKWAKAQLELEGLFFYIELPWSSLLTSGWSITPLMSRLGRGLHVLGAGHQNLCDARDTPEDAKMLSLADARGLLP